MRRLLRRPLLVALVLAVVAAASAIGGLATAQGGHPPHQASLASTPGASLRISSTTPVAGGQVAPDANLDVTFSRPLAFSSPQPTLSPAVQGTWAPSGPDSLTFEPSAGLLPGTKETVEIPGGLTGMKAADGAYLPSGVSVSFSVAPMSVLRTQQLLAELGYMPVTFTPAAGTGPAADQMALDQAGNFSWKWSTLPGSFTALWQEGQLNPITTGAVMAFEAQAGLATDGVAGPEVWGALLHAVAAGQHDTNPNYDWVDVSSTIPETATVWRNGAAVYTTPANTGIAAAPTQPGTWSVYERFTSTTMSGTNPNGTHYDDPGVPWVSYFHGGDALHGFVRASYGTPQSLGCVEMPPANAAVVYPLTPLGTLVTVEPNGAPPDPTGPTTFS